MEMEFVERELRCLRQSAADVAATEQTVELRLPENMPPIGRVLGAWGQCLVRGKEWQGSYVAVNGGVMVNALYEGEDGKQLQCVQGWIPFQLSWELKDSHRDGNVIVSCVVREVDARQVGTEKMILRASVSAMAQALEEESYPWWEVTHPEENVQLQQQEVRFCVPTEAGERKIRMEETILPPPGQMDMDRLLFGQLIPSVKEAKVMEDKLVFRGTAAYHVVYLGVDGMLHVWDGELPISQFAQLERECSAEAELWVDPAVTDLEFTCTDNGQLGITAEILGQYVVYDHPAISLVTDAYCPHCSVELHRQQVMIPRVMACRNEQLPLNETIPGEAAQALDSGILVAQPRFGDGQIHMEGMASAIYYDDENRLCAAQLPVDRSFPMPEGKWQGWLSALQKARSTIGAESIGLQAAADLRLMSVDREGISMVTGISVGDPGSKEGLPQLILRKANGMSLWELAKKCGSTVDAIRQANGLEGEPEAEQMLIIPVA